MRVLHLLYMSGFKLPYIHQDDLIEHPLFVNLSSFCLSTFLGTPYMYAMLITVGPHIRGLNISSIPQEDTSFHR